MSIPNLKTVFHVLTFAFLFLGGLSVSAATVFSPKVMVWVAFASASLSAALHAITRLYPELNLPPDETITSKLGSAR